MSDPARTHRVLHLTDLHLTGSGIDSDGVDAAGSLVGLLDDLRFVTRLDLVVVSGDIADDGSVAGCTAALQQLSPFAAAHGAPLVLTVGNHDDRDAFAEVFGSGHLSAAGTDTGLRAPVADRTCAVSLVDGLRVVTLDSLVPGQRWGELGAEQLAWLDRLLADAAPAGTLLMLHHPPAALPDRPVRDTLLRDWESLADLLPGSDVQAVLCGHVHHQMSAFLAGVPVWSAPGVVSQVDLTSPGRVVRAVQGASAAVVDLGGTYGPMCHVLHARDPAAGQQVYLYDAITDEELDTEE